MKLNSVNRVLREAVTGLRENRSGEVQNAIRDLFQGRAQGKIPDVKMKATLKRWYKTFGKASVEEGWSDIKWNKFVKLKKGVWHWTMPISGVYGPGSR